MYLVDLILTVFRRLNRRRRTTVFLYIYAQVFQMSTLRWFNANTDGTGTQQKGLRTVSKQHVDLILTVFRRLNRRTVPLTAK